MLVPFISLHFFIADSPYTLLSNIMVSDGDFEAKCKIRFHNVTCMLKKHTAVLLLDRKGGHKDWAYCDVMSTANLGNNNFPEAHIILNISR